MTAIPISAPVIIPIMIVMIVVAVSVFGAAIIAASVTVFFDFTPGCCHQQTGQAE